MTDTTERAEALPLVLEFTSTMDGHQAAIITNTKTQGGAWVYSDTDPLTFALLRTQAERIASLEAERDKLRAEVERLRPNAMRYEFLRDDINSDWAICEWSHDEPDGLGYYRDARAPEFVDAAIDQARTTHKDEG